MHIFQYPASTPLPVPNEGALGTDTSTNTNTTSTSAVPEIAGAAPSDELLSFLSSSQKMNCSQLSNDAGTTEIFASNLSRFLYSCYIAQFTLIWSSCCCCRGGGGAGGGIDATSSSNGSMV